MLTQLKRGQCPTSSSQCFPSPLFRGVFKPQERARLASTLSSPSVAQRNSAALSSGCLLPRRYSPLLHLNGRRGVQLTAFPHCSNNRSVRGRPFTSSAWQRAAAGGPVDAEIVEPEATTQKPTSNQKKEEEEEERGTIEESETLKGKPEKHEFQSETRKLLDIVAKSLYTEKEVFIRELISNASDALEKVRHMQQSKEIADKYLDMEVQLSVDEKKKTLTIQDFGVGMTKEELVENLGTIAHSGTEQFIKNMGGGISPENIIGQFGVGFYSVFMVADHVNVYSRSATPDSLGYCWSSDGSGTYTITEADGVTRGTKIVIHLKEGCKQFAKKLNVENIIKKYSNFVGFPIKLNGERVNTVKPLWTLPKDSITEQEHKEFYQFLAHSYDEPMYRLHFTSDSPFSLQSIFYVPEQHQEKYGMGRMEPGVNLFSRKVLIKPKMKSLLPDWLRFIKGVVDCEDISLHVSREHFQDSELIKRLGNVLTSRLLKHFEAEAKSDPKKYNTKFWAEFGNFLKEGICTDTKWKDDLGKLLRCESSHVQDGELITLEEYVDRMPEQQKQIYYLVAPNRKFAEGSPYYEGFKKEGLEVLFLYSNIDDFVMQNLGEFKGKRLVSVESAEAPSSKKPVQDEEVAMAPSEVEDFSKWLQNSLSDKVSSVKETKRLVSTPAIVVDHESASFRRMMKFVDPSRAPKLPKQRLEINTAHPVISKLNQIRQVQPNIAKMVAEQIYDDALIAAGLMDDARAMLPRLNSILELALESRAAADHHKASDASDKADTTAAN